MMRWLALLAFFAVTPAFGQADVVASCGSVTLKAGVPHNVTVDLNGASCRLGGGGGGGSSGPPPVLMTWDPATVTNTTNLVLSNGNLTGTFAVNNGLGYAYSGPVLPKGKVYWEVTVNASSPWSSTGLGNKVLGMSTAFSISLSNGGAIYNTWTEAIVLGVPVVGDVIGFALDTTGTVWARRNAGPWNDPTVGADPATGTGGFVFPGNVHGGLVGPYYAIINTSSSPGAITANFGATAFAHAPPAGFVAANTPPCSQATNYLARTTNGDEGGNGANIIDLICGLVADGVWSKLDTLYLPAQQNDPDARLNLVNGNYSLTGVATFTAYRGFSALPVAGLDTGFNAALAPSPHFAQNDASVGVWPYQAVVSGGFEFGNGAGGLVAAQTNIATRFSDGSTYIRVNGFSASGNFASPGTNGLYVGDRSAFDTVNSYVNGVAATPLAVTSVTPTNANFTLGVVGGFASSQIVSGAFLGGSLGAAGNLAIYNRLRTYMTAVGLARLRENGPPDLIKPTPTKEPKK